MFQALGSKDNIRVRQVLVCTELSIDLEVGRLFSIVQEEILKKLK